MDLKKLLKDDDSVRLKLRYDVNSVNVGCNLSRETACTFWKMYM